LSTDSEFIHTEVARLLKTIPDIHTVINGVVPPPSAIRHYPTLAIDYAVIKRREGRVLNSMDIEEEIDLYLYNQQPSSALEDISTGLIKKIDIAIQQDPVLRDNTVSCFISEVVSDGGVLHPQGGRTLHRLTLYVTYIERCIT